MISLNFLRSSIEKQKSWVNKSFFLKISLISQEIPQLNETDDGKDFVNKNFIEFYKKKSDEIVDNLAKVHCPLADSLKQLEIFWKSLFSRMVVELG